MKRKSSKKCMAIFMAAMLAVSGEDSVPELRVMAQELEHVQETKNTQAQTNKGTVREVLFPYMHTVTGSAAHSDNIGANNYSRWSTTVKSYLQNMESGNLQRVEAIDNQVVVEEFSPDFQLIRQKQIEYELPIFGGYFSGKDYQFLVFGQSNNEESDNKEIMRIVKYDKEWNRLSSASVCGANTTIPFDAGSLRMAEDNGKLFVHTCHEMYTSEDGKNHQANMSYVVTEETMQVEQYWYDIMNIRYGYVSHSFNQFLIVEDGKLYRMDHGDTYLRSIVISKCDQSAITSCGYESVWPIQGEMGDNITGVSVGGFEKAGKYLVVAGNSCTQESEEAWNADKKRNIFLTSTNANTIRSNANYWNDSDSEEVLEEEATKKIWLTNYTSADAVSVRTPHLVKASDNLLYVMWEEENTETKTTTVKIVGVDAQGNKVTDMASIYGRLSDCKPISENDGTIQWYTSSDGNAGGKYDWDDNGNFSYIEASKEKDVIFYKVDTDRLGEYQFTEKFNFSDVEASLEGTEFTYDPEKKCTPKVVATYKGAYLEEDRDFSLQYKNNKMPGQATVTLKGMGCFSGSKDLNFTIKPQNVTAIKAGTRYEDSVTKAWYQITKASNGKYEAAYLKPTNKNTTTIKIPAIIKVDTTNILITSVAKNACSGCNNLTKVTIGANITKIGSKAFYKCTNLKSILIPKKVTTIDTKAFAKNSKLTSITIKGTKLTTKSFGSNVFAGIHQNAKIKVPKSKKKSYEKLLRKTGIKKTVKIVGK